MATKPQAKAAVDAASVTTKAEIDKLPTGVNIKDGFITFGPTHINLILSMGGQDLTATEAFLTSITNALTLEGRSYTVLRGRRAEDGERAFTIETALVSYRLVDFTIP